MRRVHFAFLALTAGLLISGCGDSDEDVGLGTAAGSGGADAGGDGSAGFAGKGSGGKAGSAGSAGSAGAAGSAGTAGAAGSTATGGSAGSVGGSAGTGQGGANPDAGDDGSSGGSSGQGGSSGEGGAAGEAGASAGGAAGASGAAGQGGSGGTCGGAADKCPGVVVSLVGSGTDPRLGAVKGDSSALCADYEGGCGFTGASKEAVYQVVADVTGTLIVDTAGSIAALNGYDPVLYARSSCSDTLTQLACNDVIPPQTDVITMKVTAGQTVYVFVDAFDGSAGTYQVNFKLVPAVCGNGVVEPPEDCDDQNQDDLDGCTTGCKFDSSVVADKCPGGVLTLTGSATQKQGTASGNTQWYANDAESNCGGVYAAEGVFSFTPDISGTATVSLGGSTQTPFDAVLYARSTCDLETTEIDCNETSTAGGEQIQFPVVAGTPYFVFVDGLQGATGPFKAQVIVDAAACGNGKKEGGEECDDGNQSPGDGCLACALEPPGPLDECPGVPITLTKTGSSWKGVATATTLNLGANYSGTCGSSSSAPDAVYSLASVPAGKATITITNATYDAVLYVRSGSCTGPQVKCDDNVGDGGDQVVFDTVPGSSYWVFVDGFSGESGTFTLDVSIAEPACGNGVVESGESCDDGDLQSGDGCDAQCKFEGQCGSLVEAEPNAYDTPQPIPPACGTFLLQAAMPLADADYYLLSLVAGTELSAWTFVGAPGQCNSSTDTVLSLWSSPIPIVSKESGGCGTGHLACDDQDSDNSPCSAITYQVPATGDYVLRAHNYYTTKEIPSYGVMVSVR